MDVQQPTAGVTVEESRVPESIRTVVVMPAYNAARTLERTVADLPPDGVEQVLLVPFYVSRLLLVSCSKIF